MGMGNSSLLLVSCWVTDGKKNVTDRATYHMMEEDGNAISMASKREACIDWIEKKHIDHPNFDEPRQMEDGSYKSKSLSPFLLLRLFKLFMPIMLWILVCFCTVLLPLRFLHRVDETGDF